MRKTAILLVFTILLSLISSVPMVSAAHTYQETFSVSRDGATTIAGNYYTRTGWTDAHNNGTYWYAVEATYGWCEWDLNVTEAGMYRISIKSGTDGGTSKMKLFRNNITNNATTTKKATEIVSTTIIPGMINSIWDKTETELATIYLEKGITTIQLDNYGDRKYVHEIIITPVDDNIKLERSVTEYISRLLTDNNTYTASADEKYNMVHSSKYINYKINVPESGNYLFSLNYSNYYSATYPANITVSVGTTEDALTSLGTFILPAKTKTNGGTLDLINVPVAVLPLTAGEQYFQLKGYAEPYYGKMYLEKIDELDSTTTATFISPLMETTPVISSGIGLKYSDTIYENEITAKNMEESYNIRSAVAAKYDLYMNIATSSTYGYQITLSVDGEEQSFKREESTASTGWGDYQYIKVGTVTLPQGTSSLTINSKGYSYTDSETGKTRFYGYMYFKDFKLVPSGNEILANTYTDTEPTFTLTSLNKKLAANVEASETTDNVVRLAPTNSVTYSVDVEKGGLYSIKALSHANTTNAYFTIAVNGQTMSTKRHFKTARRYEYINLGYLNLKQGANNVTITLDEGITVDVLALYIEEPETTLHEGTSASKVIDSITVPEGGLSNKTYTAKIAFNDVLAGADAKYTIAIYEEHTDGSKTLAYSNTATITDVTGSEIKDIAVSGVNLLEGKSYSAKVFLWDKDTLIGSCKEF